METESINNVNQTQLAKEKRDIAIKQLEYSNQRENENADSFITLQIQVAAILLALSGTFSSNLEVVKKSPFRELFIMGLLLLLLSLIFGIINVYKKRIFWFLMSKANYQCYYEMSEARDGKIPLQHALESCQKAYGGTDYSKSPSWPWIAQSSLLFLGLLFTLGAITLGLYL